MKISVVLTTYNQPAWLENVIWGYSTQSFQNFEVVVADDGSTSDTLLLVKRLQLATGLDIYHFCHQYKGFRKCTILNRAIIETSGDYLVFSDGDCIPRPDFLECHYRMAKPNLALSGGCVRLSKTVSDRITSQDVTDGNATRVSWLFKQGLRSPKDIAKAGAGSIGGLLDHVTTTRATFNGSNTSVEKDAVLRVNGFNERMRYGGLDRELGERLENDGLRHKQVRHRAVCVHLWHERPYMDEKGLARNNVIRYETKQRNCAWTPYGIVQQRDERPLSRAA